MFLITLFVDGFAFKDKIASSENGGIWASSGVFGSSLDLYSRLGGSSSVESGDGRFRGCIMVANAGFSSPAIFLGGWV